MIQKDTKGLNIRVRIQSFYWCILSFVLGTKKPLRLVQNWRASLGTRKSKIIYVIFIFNVFLFYLCYLQQNLCPM